MSESSADAYKNIGFGATPIGFGERPGIVVVDFQTGFTDPQWPLGGRPMVVRAVENTATLLKAARAANLPVASCYIAYSGGRDAPHWKIPSIPELFRHGHPSTALDPRIHDPAYDVVFAKTGPSIFFQTPLVHYGFRVAVPEDCVGDVEQGPHDDNLRDVGRRYADIVTLDQTLAYIEQVRHRNTA